MSTVCARDRYLRGGTASSVTTRSEKGEKSGGSARRGPQTPSAIYFLTPRERPAAPSQHDARPRPDARKRACLVVRRSFWTRARRRERRLVGEGAPSERMLARVDRGNAFFAKTFCQEDWSWRRRPVAARARVCTSATRVDPPMRLHASSVVCLSRPLVAAHRVSRAMVAGRRALSARS